MSRFAGQPAKADAHDEVLAELTAGGGRERFERLLRDPAVRGRAIRRASYVLLSLISAATRSRAVAHSRSTVLADRSNACAVSSTDKPAK